MFCAFRREVLLKLYTLIYFYNYIKTDYLFLLDKDKDLYNIVKDFKRPLSNSFTHII